MAQFLLLLHADPKPWLTMSPAEQQKWFGKYMAWGTEARECGYLLGSNKLVDDAGKLMRGKSVTDGPYSETKEVLGGYYLIESANYDEAVKRTKDHPALEHGGTIEVRQVEQMPK